MSPEQANGEQLDGRSDLFAVGVMLWEMLCGRPLFAGNSTQETLARLLFAPVLPPRQLRPDVPVDLERVTMRLLERDLAARYRNAEAAIADLIACADHPRSGRELLIATLAQRFAGTAPVRASGGVSAAEAATFAPPPGGPSTMKLPGPSDRVPAVAVAATRGSHKGLWLALGAVVVVGGAITAVVASGGGARPTSATPGSTISGSAVAPRPAPPVAQVPLDAGVDAATAVAIEPPAVDAGMAPAHIHATGHAPTTRPPPPGKKGDGAGIVEVKLGGQ
jgi:serine/threonine-protein kinase